MTIEVFLKIDDIEGESMDAVHRGEMDVLAWSFGASSSGSPHVGSGAGAGRVNVQDLSLTKYVDKSSPVLMLACCTGKRYPTARLTLREVGATPVEFLVIELSDVVLSSVSTGGSTGEDRPTERVSLGFARFTYSYTSQRADGSTDTPVAMGWDVEGNLEV